MRAGVTNDVKPSVRVNGGMAGGQEGGVRPAGAAVTVRHVRERGVQGNANL